MRPFRIQTVCLTVLTLILAGAAIGQCPSLTLAPGGPQNFHCSPTTVALSPVSGRWNVVAITSQSNWNLSLPPALSSNTSTADYAVANGTLGAIPAGPAVVSSAGVAAYRCDIQHVSATALNVNAPVTTTFAAGHVVRIFEFTVAAPGPHTITAGGNPSSLHWDLFLPGTDAVWRPRSARAADGAMSASQTLQLGAGVHALVVVRDSATLPSSFPLTVAVTCGASTLALSPGNQATIVAPCRNFVATPAPGRFNVVGMGSDANWDMAAGGAASTNPGPTRDFFVGDARNAALPTLTGTFTAAPGSAPGTVLFANIGTPLAVNIPNLRMWTGSRPFEVMEFEVPAAGVHIFTTTGPPGVGFGVHGPSSVGTWRARNTSELFRADLSGGASSHFLAAGWHAFIVHDDTSGPVTSPFPIPQPYTVQMQLVAPTVTSVNPDTIHAGSPAATITVNGANFHSGSVVQWDLSPVTTNFVGPGQLQATISASLLASPGTAAVRVENAALSVSNSLNVSLVGPHIDFVQPAAVPYLPGSTYPFVIQVDGSGFTGSTVLHLNGIPRMTSFAGANRVECTLTGVPQASMPGGIAFTAVNFGTVVSNSVALIVGSGNNRGTIVRTPPAPAPGSPYGVRIEGGIPAQPLSLLVSLAETQPQTGWPTPALDFVLGLDLGTMAPVVDGVGIFGPPAPAAFTAAPGGTPPFGVYEIGGFVLPATPVGIDLSLQAVYLDPASPAGFRLTWARYPESL